MLFFDPMVTGDENFYSALQKIDWYYMDDKEEYQYAKQFIKNTDKVLDVGAGKGAFANIISTKQYVGLDLSIGAKELAEINGITIENESIQEHANKFPKEYDVVCSFQVLEHVSDPYSFIKAQQNALKYGGLLIIAVPSEDSFLKYVVNGVLNMPPHHVTRWSDQSLHYIETLFELKLINLNHEKLQEVHKKSYFSTFIQSLFLKPTIVDDSIIRRLVSKIAYIITVLIEKKVPSELLPYGHTVVAVYKKVKL
ncbi:methyltransferase domain-containing protein [Candidatus Oleimmundimicrobium sp.]|uniref:class I SAM-dependent methyltransferase n=1 Tax=Candidatus Oleimmundimicrobium sp. TaxID=3060597 RepID=UPI00271BE53F|nr:methyltransferase domain-containing protein [Candidatus Oleimmundimicrobium sp.]MDO8886364.1 methyltransferase domain-containing protein [Candidatus Oleimmundimicrobium sp.]